MITLKILIDYLSTLNINIVGKSDLDLYICSVELLSKDTTIKKDTLYLTDNYNLLNKNYNNIILVTTNEIVSENSINFITSYSAENIYLIIFEFLFRNYSLNTKKYCIYNSLYNAKSLKEILSIAETFIQNPIFIVDTSYSILCRSNLAENITSSIQKENNNNYLIFDIVNLMRKYKCIDNIYNLSHSFFHHDKDNLIFCSIKLNDVTTSYICVLENNRTFLEEDLELVDSLSNVVSSFAEKEHVFVANSGLSDEYYLIDLIANKIQNIDYIKERLKFSNFILKDNFAILSIPFIQKYKDYRYNYGLKQLMESIKKLFKNCLSAYYEENIIFLISSNEYSVISNNALIQFEDFLKLNNLKCGISYTFNNLLNINDFLAQSTFAGSIISNSEKAKYIAFFKDYSDYYLFNTIQDREPTKQIQLSNLVHPLVYKLIEYDKENNSELFKTLKAYIEHNRNGNNTACFLNINRSTFFYRFHKIEEILNININSYIYKIESSLRILKYTELSK